MIINEKALVRQMKEAYKNQGYTVAVNNDIMVICSGYWLVQVESDNVPAEVLSLFAMHMRKIPENGDAYKVVKGDDGSYVQKKLIADALGPVETMEKLLAEADEDGGAAPMKKTNLRYDGCSVWQSQETLGIFLIDPRYEALIAADDSVCMLGTGIYAEGNISKIWIMRVDKKYEQAKIQHLAGIRWVAI